uniref:Multiple epidermal growth factor-like domains protein 10 n=1 Tax=Romanomermis culicivorax TaxID=13658 RepID=A0A915KXY5_ROMCU
MHGFLRRSTICIFFTFELVSCLEGPNVCTTQKKFTTTVTETYDRPYSYRVYQWCSDISKGFRCARNQIAYKTAYRNVTKEDIKYEDVCCEGYIVTTDQRCKPHCTEECIHGTCSAPGLCSCNSGYGGSNCEKSCPYNRFGPSCEKTCDCQNGASCDPVLGICFCPDGFMGEKCADRCKHGYFGHVCSYACHCLNNATCDAISGNCTCPPGFQGHLCERSCPADQHGEDCKYQCSCKNDGFCSATDGSCTCLPGYKVRTLVCCAKDQF